MRRDEDFDGFFAANYATVCRAVVAVTRDRGVAEDAAQEAFARALERWHRLRDQTTREGWVVVTALNVARRSLRKRPDPEPQTEAIDPILPDIDLWRAVAALPPRQQEAVVLHYIVDLTTAQVANAMGCDQGTVKTHLSRARAHLDRSLRGSPT